MSSLSGAKYKTAVPSGAEPASGVSSKDAPETGSSHGAVKDSRASEGASVQSDNVHRDISQRDGVDRSNGQREAALLQKAQAGDRSAYGQIVVLYQDRLFNALLRMVGEAEEARELTQETFTRGLEKIETFRGEASPYTWLFRIGMNLAISNLRRSQRARVFSLDGSECRGARHDGNGQSHRHDQAAALVERIAAADGQSPAGIAERNERHQVVLDALGRIDGEYRAVLVMRDVEGFDYQQMADVLGLPLGTLKSRLFRARLALRDELKPYMEEKRK
jgi:RNA polymerase sigma-70 factor (ECF subfamily)